MRKLDSGPARGTRDFLPPEVARRESLIAEIQASYARFGFRRVETPAIENIERLSSGEGGENEHLIYRILRRGLPESLPAGEELGELVDLGLRYDLTVPLARYYVNNSATLDSPFRSLQIGPVWRAERPAKGRFRQFVQCDIDVIGEPSVLAECELVEATATTLLGLRISPLTVRLNDRHLLAALASEAGIQEESQASFFVTLDKLDRVGWEGVLEELGAKGFEEAASKRARELVTELSAASAPGEFSDRARELLPAVEDAVLSDLAETARSAEQLGEEVSFLLDPTLVRGMGYYTGQIFEISHGESDGSIAGGGRYDELLGRFAGRPIPACGFSIGFERVVDIATVEQELLGVALIYGDEPPSEILAAARQLRASEPAVALVARRKSFGRQLADLYEQGYRSFATLKDGSPGEKRALTP